MNFNYHSGSRLQRGHGIHSFGIHKGPRIQRGHGIGSIISGLFRTLRPVTNVVKNIMKNPTVKQIAKTALDVGKDAAVDIAADLIEGKDIKETAQNKLDSARTAIANQLRDSALRSRTTKDLFETTRKRKRKQKVKPFKTKRYKSDIFE